MSNLNFGSLVTPPVELNEIIQYLPNAAAAPVVPIPSTVTQTFGTSEGQGEDELTSDSENDSDNDSSDTEMSDGGPRRVGSYLRLKGVNKALIRYLINHGVEPREIHQHPDCGWGVPTINRYKDMSDEDDERYFTPDFRRILTEIRETRKTKRRGMPKRRAKAEPVNVGRRSGKGQRVRASTKQSADTKHLSVVTESASKAISPRRNTDTGHFLRAFVENAHLNDDCYDMLKNAGFTKADKLQDVAELGKVEVEKFVAAELPGMTPVDKALLVKAFVSLAGQV
ncbi:hypothetical protein B0H11DRAFT_2235203 [Mycena galericulata]|nr:hypothetical protein B0H11DRAFT_2235203 [Mycena galericulata]